MRRDPEREDRFRRRGVAGGRPAVAAAPSGVGAGRGVQAERAGVEEEDGGVCG